MEACWKADDIYKAQYEGWYCVGKLQLVQDMFEGERCVFLLFDQMRRRKVLFPSAGSSTFPQFFKVSSEENLFSEVVFWAWGVYVVPAHLPMSNPMTL